MKEGDLNWFDIRKVAVVMWVAPLCGCSDATAACDNMWDVCYEREISGQTGSYVHYDGYMNWCEDFVERRDLVDCWADATSCDEYYSDCE
ncbi:MAG: hypothetical protein DRI90_02960 [Deltaproteobacteria bacterium]|nr:MAG: hypothetical protein DRI90_02960 [Deltaproteobacteria bacterium]